MDASSAMTIIMGVCFLVLVIMGFTKMLSKNKKKSGNLYTPYDDMTRGTNNTNDHKHLEEDTRHIIPVEEQHKID